MQIVFRYVLNDSLVWSEELAKAMMVWTAFLVAPWAYRIGANVRIELFIDEMPLVFRNSLTLLLNALVFWIVAVFFWESVGFWQRGLTVQVDSLPFPVAWFYSIVPITFAFMVLVGAELLLRNILTLLNPDEVFDLSHLNDAYQIE
jgi:TRAP-type C4-dicarboxylate transport system permease small subunit